MADQVISDAIPGIQDEGIASVADGNEDWGSAGLRMMLAQAVDSDSYVRSDSELTFTAHDGTNDTVDVTAGVAYLDLTGQTIDVQSAVGGSDPPTYDTTLPTEPAIPVIVPTTVAGVALQDSTLSKVWLAYDTDGTGPGSAGSVYVRSDDTGSVSAPSHPNVELGSANPDDSTADTLANRFGSPTFNAVSAGQADITNETFVRATRSSTSASISSLTWANVFDGEAKDVRGEFNSSQQFVPDESGEYVVVARVQFGGSSSAGDNVQARIYNTTDSTEVGRLAQELPLSNGRSPFVFIEQLSAGDAYECQAQNRNSSFEVETDTVGVIKRSVVA